MTTMLASKGRFMALTAGLIGIAVYLGIALSWSEGLPMTQIAESKSEQPAVEAENVVREVEEKSDEPDGDQQTEISSTAQRSDVKSNESGGSKIRRTTTQVGNKSSESAPSIRVDVAEPSVQVASKPGNPLDDAIDPDLPGIAKLALTSDFESLVDSGVDVSTAVRFIDERVDGGKYGEEVIRK